MAKQQILLVDADTSSARLLEVSLRGAGFNIATASSAEDALGKLEHGTPDLILTEARLPGVDGFSFVRTLRARPELAETPVVFLTEQGALEDKLRGLELGVDDYLAKPIMVREVVTRVQLLLARKKQQRTLAEPQARTRFSGSLEDVAVVDVLQTVAISGKSGVASVKRGEREALLYFDRGQIIDAEVGDLRGEEAVYRTITWATGTFDVEFRPVERERVIEVSHQGLLMEGLRRVDELGRLAEQLPPENAVVDVDHDALASRLNEIPDELNGILRLIDGKRTLLDLIDASPFDDLSTLTVLSKFYFEGLLLSVNPEPVEWAPGSRPMGQEARGSVPPPSERAREAAVSAATPVPPPTRGPHTSPTVPAPMESLRETNRPTPPPSTARAAAPEPEVKLTPKGIVNIGDSPPPPPKQMPSPFKAANDATRRSPIPMPAGSHPRANGALGHSGSRSNGARESRTMHGLSATPLQRAAAQAAPAPPSTDMEVAPDAKRRASDAVVLGVIPREQAEPAETVPAPASRPAEPAGSVPGSNPEPEHEFFEAGDEGTYAGGPRSVAPERSIVRDSDEPPAASRNNTPSRRVRARRSTIIVASVIGLAAVPLLVAGVRHLAQRAEPSPEPGAWAAQPAAPTSVQQPGGAVGVSPPSTGVSPPGSTPATLVDAGLSAPAPAPPAAAEAAPAAGEPTPGSPAPPSEAARPPASAPAPVTPSPAPRPRAPRRANEPPPPAPVPVPVPAPSAPAPSEAPSEGKDAPAPAAPTKPGEKPPTASYPLR